MKKLAIALLGLTAASCAFANGAFTPPQHNTAFGLQGGLVSGGYAIFGVAVYAPNFEAGVLGSAVFNDARAKTSEAIPGAFIGFRHFFLENTAFSLGVDGHMAFGKVDGRKISSSYGVAPYLGLEQQLSKNLLLTGWVNPYAYQYDKMKYGKAVTTHGIVAAGLALTFLFN